MLDEGEPSLAEEQVINARQWKVKKLELEERDAAAARGRSDSGAKRHKKRRYASKLTNFSKWRYRRRSDSPPRLRCRRIKRIGALRKRPGKRL